METSNQPLLLDFHHVSIKRGENTALENLSLQIPLGQNVAILGPNGSGKSSFIKAITRECYPLAGDDGAYLKILKKDTWDVFELRKHLGIVSSDTLAPNPDMTCRDAVLSGFFSTFSLWRQNGITDEMRHKTAQALSTMGVEHLAERCFCDLSSGEARRVIVARALAHQPHSLLLDEPMANLDIQASTGLREMLSHLAEDGRQILMVTHSISDIIPEIERIIVLKNGRLIADGTKEEVLTSTTLSALFGLNVQIVKNGRFFHLI